MIKICFKAMSEPYIFKPKKIRLGVNIDHAATLRQARYREVDPHAARFVEPDVVLIAQLAEKAGADGITVHLREDRRHIQDEDVRRLRRTVKTHLNLEMALSQEILEFALKLRPQAVCIVPENRREVTTEGGLDAAGQRERLAPFVAKLSDAGIEVSLFIDSDLAQVETAAAVKAPYIELHTGAYSNAYDTPRRAEEFHKLKFAAEAAAALGLKVNAGHGVNYINAEEVRTLPFLNELNIGHSILSRALFTGVEEAVRAMKELLNPELP